jgi:hypothetical protein
MDPSPETRPPARPVVRYMTVSDDLRVTPANPRLIDVLGLLYAVRPRAGAAYPLVYPQLCVYLALTDCRGDGDGWLECANDDTGARVFRSARHRIEFGDDPLRVVGVRFRVADCPFPAAGVYALQFWYNAEVIEQKFVQVR